jgi:general secretion pathway protein D
MIIRATVDELDRVEAAVAKLNPPPQITLEVVVAELTEGIGSASGLRPVDPTKLGPEIGGDVLDRFSTNLLIRMDPTRGLAQTNILVPGGANAAVATVLTEPQYRLVLQALQQRAGTDVLTAPKVTTISGRSARIKVVDVKSINTIATNSTGTPTGEKITQPVEVGPIIDISPQVLANGSTIELKVTGTVNEFLGYEAKSGLLATNGSLPVFRLCQSSSTAKVPDQGTLLLSPGVIEDEKTIKDKVPVLGDIPVLGPLFRKESTEKTHKRLFFFITPTIVDPAGNPVHPPAPAFPPQAIPQKPVV